MARAGIGGGMLAIAGVIGVFGIGPWLEETLGFGWAAWLPVVIAVIGVAWAGYAFLQWLRILYVLTDTELYVKEGLISRDVTQIRLARVQNTTFEQSVLARILRFGDVHIYTAGSGTEDITFRHVPNPQAITGMVTEAANAMDMDAPIADH